MSEIYMVDQILVRCQGLTRKAAESFVWPRGLKRIYDVSNCPPNDKLLVSSMWNLKLVFKVVQHNIDSWYITDLMITTYTMELYWSTFCPSSLRINLYSHNFRIRIITHHQYKLIFNYSQWEKSSLGSRKYFNVYKYRHLGQLQQETGKVVKYISDRLM